MTDKDGRPLGRRAFMADVAATGAVLLGSVMWGMSAHTADAKSTPTPSPPPEHDHPPMPGEVVAPPSPKASPRPKGSPTPRKPTETDYQRPAGGVPAPHVTSTPKETDHRPLPGKIAAPRTPSPRPSQKPN